MNWELTDNPLYEVSDTGLVRHVDALTPVAPFVHRSGHLYVKWRRTGGHQSRQVHRLVIEAFVGSCPAGQECRHLDGNPLNNNLSNLAWGTRAENISDYRRLHGRHHRAKTTLETARLIRQRFTGKRGERTALADEFGLSLSIVSRIILGRIYL